MPTVDLEDAEELLARGAAATDAQHGDVLAEGDEPAATLLLKRVEHKLCVVSEAGACVERYTRNKVKGTR